MSRRHPIALRSIAMRTAAALAVVSALAACNNKRVSRIDPQSVTDLSGRWNDTDSRLVANELITQSLGSPWASEYAQSHAGATPAVIVGTFQNRTLEHIPVETFVQDLENAYVKSGAVRVVASADERQEVRAERVDQQSNAAADSRAQLAREQGAQYMLQGDLNAIQDQEGRETVIYYQIDAALVDLTTNAKVWVGQEKIKKYVDRRRVGW